VACRRGVWHSSWDVEVPGGYRSEADFRTPPTRPKRRTWLHAALLLVTLCTLFVAGLTFWAAGGPLDGLGGALRGGAIYALCVTAILLAHEMGHYLACRHYGVPATLPFFIPGIPPIGTFGAVIRIRGRIPHRKALFDIAAAGPIAGFVVALPVLALGLARAEPFEPGLFEGGGTVFRFGRPVASMMLRPLLLGETREIAVNAWYGAGWIGMLVTSLNLFPVGQLDGGHAAFAISRRLHRVLSRATPLVLIALVAVQSFALETAPAYLVWIGVLLWMRDRHPPLLDVSSPIGRTRKLLAILLALMFALSFVLVPIRAIDL
jgi:membrane-associated protease RseP (regulator of RpoE activity)